jgi:hypothetical protein
MEILFLRGVLLILCGLFNLSLAVLLFVKKKENKAVFHLAITAVFSSLFSFIAAITNFSWNSQISYSAKLLWNRATWLGVLILPAYLCFVYYFTGRTKRIRTKALFWYAIAIAISLLALFTPYFIEFLVIESPTPIEKPGMLDVFGRIYIIAAIIVGLSYILKEYSLSRGFRRLQLKYFVLGLVIYSIGGIIFTGILPIVQGASKYFDITALFSSFWVGLTSYAIVRYRLMDIRIALGKIVVFLLSLFTAIYFSSILIFVDRQLAEPLPITTLILLTVLLIISLLKLTEFYEGLVQMYFYPGFTKKRFILSNLEKELTYLLEIGLFSSLLVQSLNKAFGLTKIAILTKKAREERFDLQKNLYFDEKGIKKLLTNKSFLSVIGKTKRAFEVQEIPTLLDKKASKEEFRTIRGMLSKIGVEVLIPLLFERKIIGLIFLGEKNSGEAFSSEELQLLTNISRQASIALRNTLLYSEAKKRKEELERFYRLTVDKEIRIVDLRRKILDLERRLNENKEEGE